MGGAQTTRRMQDSLLAWYDVHKRDLPWRRDTDPYRVLVSEVMLQQTRVDVVAPYYIRWMQRWPTVEQLAAADVEGVVAAWSGLGYYRRARNLHTAAEQVAAHGWPDDLTDLPGVGPYVAGALGSIAFGLPVPAIDGNVQRVLARLFAVMDEVSKARGRRIIEAHATALVHPDRPGDWAQALMELGAVVCTPTSPACPACPVATHCAGRTDPDGPVRFPLKAAKPRPVDEPVHLAAVLDGDRILLVRRPPGLLGGTWGLPGGPTDTPLEDMVREQTGMVVRVAEEAGEATHTFSHRRWHLRVHRADVLEVGSDAALSVRWVPLDALDTVGLSTAMHKAIAAAGLSVPRPQAH